MSNERDTPTELHGAVAQVFIAQHLRQIADDPINWTTEYICPETGERWILDYPFPEAHGSGPPRLRKLTVS